MKKIILSAMLALTAPNMQAGKRVYKVSTFTGVDASGMSHIKNKMNKK